MFIIQSQFEAFLYLTQLFLFDQRIPQGASSPYQEKLTTFPLTQVKKYHIVIQNNQIRRFIDPIPERDLNSQFLDSYLKDFWLFELIF